MAEFNFGGVSKKITIRGVCARPSALYVINTQSVQRSGNAGFILKAERHAMGLLSIAQGSVVKVDFFASHNEW